MWRPVPRFLNGSEDSRQRFWLVQLEEHPAQAIEKGGVIGFQFDGPLDEHAGFFPVSLLLGPHVAHVVHGVGEIGCQFQAFQKVLLRLSVIAVAFAGGPI